MKKEIENLNIKDAKSTRKAQKRTITVFKWSFKFKKNSLATVAKFFSVINLAFSLSLDLNI